MDVLVTFQNIIPDLVRPLLFLGVVTNLLLDRLYKLRPLTFLSEDIHMYPCSSITFTHTVIHFFHIHCLANITLCIYMYMYYKLAKEQSQKVWLIVTYRGNNVWQSSPGIESANALPNIYHSSHIFAIIIFSYRNQGTRFCWLNCF